MSYLRNWTKTTYSINSWVKLVNEDAIVKTVIVTNTGDSPQSISFRVMTSGDDPYILKSIPIAAGETYVSDIRHIVLVDSSTLEFQSTSNDLHVYQGGTSV